MTFALVRAAGGEAPLLNTITTVIFTLGPYVALALIGMASDAKLTNLWGRIAAVSYGAVDIAMRVRVVFLPKGATGDSLSLAFFPVFGAPVIFGACFGAAAVWLLLTRRAGQDSTEA